MSASTGHREMPVSIFCSIKSEEMDDQKDTKILGHEQNSLQQRCLE
jgi:hypothetical protein